MTKFPTLKRALKLAPLALAIALPATASSVTLESTHNRPFGTPKLAQIVDITSPVPQRTLAGALRVTDVSTGIGLLAWCIELAQEFVPQATTYSTASTLVSAERLTLLDQLFTQSRDQVSDGVAGAAMQLAIWEIIFEEDRVGGTLDLALDTGVFSATAQQAAAKADGWLGTLDSSSPTGGYTFTFYQSDTAQDLMTATNINANDPSAIPLPAGAWLLLAGFGAMAGLRRRKRSA